MFGQVCFHTNGTHARTTTTMRNGKCFMQVQVTNIRTDQTGSGKSYLCIHIRTIHVHLSAMFVNYIRDFLYCFFIDPISTRISDHDTGKLLAVLRSFCFQVFHINISVLQCFYHHYFHSCHYCTGGIGTMCRDRDQHHIPVMITIGFMIGTDGQ